MNDDLCVSFNADMDAEIYHWHEEIFEILLVLRGTAIVEIIGEQYVAHENEMIFINKWMPHKVYAEDPASVYLEIHFNLLFWEQYVKNTSKIFFVRNPNILNNSSGLTRIRNLIARIYTVHHRNDEESKKQLIESGKLLFSILHKEFNYIQKSPDSYRNEEQFDRVWAVFRYMRDNHTQKITLSSMAQYVHVSESHLSHSIKVETGRSFEEWLNMFRAENAARLLVSEKMSLTKISYASGFSDPRYFNSCFKKHFRCLPSEYRAQNQQVQKQTVSLDSDNDRQKKIQELLKEKMKVFLVGKTSVQQDSHQNRGIPLNLEIDYLSPSAPFVHTWKDYIEVGNAENLHRTGTRRFLKEIQQEIGFHYVKVNHPFDGSDVSTQDGSFIIDWESLFEIYDSILLMQAVPFISCTSLKYSEDALEMLLENFLRNASILYGEKNLHHWRVSISCSYGANKRIRGLLEQYGLLIVDEPHKLTTRNYLYDTAYMVPYFIQFALSEREQPAVGFNCLFDKNAESVFTGEQGLITSGLKKPLYQAYTLLSVLGNQLLTRGKNYIVTKRYDDLQILVWNYAESIESLQQDLLNLTLSDRYSIFSAEKPMEVSIQITGLRGRQYLVKKTLFDREHGCLYDHLLDANVVRYLSKGEKDQINAMCTMKTSYDVVHGNDGTSLTFTLRENAACLIYLKKTKNQSITFDGKAAI